MVWLYPVLAIAIGLGVGLANGGIPDRILRFRPEAWPLGAAGIAIEAILWSTGWGNGWASLLDIVATLMIVAFLVFNIRVGGVVVVIVALSLNLVPTVLNWGTPTSVAALADAGRITAAQAKGDPGRISLSGPRHPATDEDRLTFLGETIAMPGGVVMSFGDIVLLVGIALVAHAIVRARILRQGMDRSYRSLVAPLGRGPMTRSGPAVRTLPEDTDRRRYDDTVADNVRTFRTPAGSGMDRGSAHPDGRRGRRP
ncbi:MAG: DUF5317 family protein [Microthrixaceae bacterium]